MTQMSPSSTGASQVCLCSIRESDVLWVHSRYTHSVTKKKETYEEHYQPFRVGINEVAAFGIKVTLQMRRPFNQFLIQCQGMQMYKQQNSTSLTIFGGPTDLLDGEDWGPLFISDPLKDLREIADWTVEE